MFDLIECSTGSSLFQRKVEAIFRKQSPSVSRHLSSVVGWALLVSDKNDHHAMLIHVGSQHFNPSISVALEQPLLLLPFHVIVLSL